MSESSRLIICGSMRAYDTMRDVYRYLTSQGVDAILPEADNLSLRATSREADALKRAASKKHFDCIRDKATYAVLVVNVDKDGEHDYIGPNAFAEIAVAFANDRRIYLWQGSPQRYSEELRAWGARELHGEISPLKEDLDQAHDRLWRQSFQHA